MLHKVRRQDGGLYECISTDTDSFLEVSGNMTLSVNCKDSTLLWGILKARRPLILTSRWARRSGTCCGGAERCCRRASWRRAESHVQRPLFPVHTHGLAQGHSSSIHTQKHIFCALSTIKTLHPYGHQSSRDERFHAVFCAGWSPDFNGPRSDPEERNL